MLKSSTWSVSYAYKNSRANDAFSTLSKTFELDGKCITKDPISSVIKVEIDGTFYYVKRYKSAGKRLRRFFGKSRIRKEWENLLYFRNTGIPTANIVAYGQEKVLGIMTRGAMITEAVPNTLDLNTMVQLKSPYLNDNRWVEKVISQLAETTEILHKNHFIHTDLKWRNILVTQERNPKIALIDCPSGTHMSGWFLTRNIIKDLACLDKVGKHVLRRTQRLSFYKQYAGIKSLAPSDKRRISQILSFFEGRE